jgi:hypothetical protein
VHVENVRRETVYKAGGFSNSYARQRAIQEAMDGLKLN